MTSADAPDGTALPPGERPDAGAAPHGDGAAAAEGSALAGAARRGDGAVAAEASGLAGAAWREDGAVAAEASGLAGAARREDGAVAAEGSASAAGHGQGRSRPGIALALVAAAAQVVGTVALEGTQALDPLAYGLLVAGGLSLSVRRRLPLVTLFAAAAATLAYHALTYPHAITTFFAAILAGVAATKAGYPRLVQATVVVSYTAWVFLDRVPWGQALRLAAWGLGAAFLIYVAVNVLRMVGKLAKEQQRLGEERRRRQASEERLRIATELHDVLGHHLSLINVRAGVGLHLMDRQPEQARAALGTIRDASAEALREVRSVLDALYPTGEGAPRAPAPRLERLAELTADAGLPVHTTISGTPSELPAEIDRAAYRIVQEALTNVRRHAGAGASATIIIEYREDSLTVQVDDDGRTPSQHADGNGIGGMRERATALGGTLEAGPLLDGGWRVSAKLPMLASASDGES